MRRCPSNGVRVRPGRPASRLPRLISCRVGWNVSGDPPPIVGLPFLDLGLPRQTARLVVDREGKMRMGPRLDVERLLRGSEQLGLGRITSIETRDVEADRFPGVQIG